jgi:hypothetical protein
MNENRISISLTDAEIKTINDAIQILADKLQPILIALEAGDKKNLAKIGEKSISFVDKVTQYAKTNPEFLPPFINADELKKDFEAFTVLNNFLRPLNQITKNLDDTATLCGSEAILAALGYYNSVGQAKKMGVPNAATIYEDLSQRFEAQKAKKNKPTIPNAGK